MMIPGKLEVAIKINQLPTEVTTTKAGWKEFKIECGGRTVTVALRPRMWNKLAEAAANWPLWLAAISGQMGQSIGQGFVLAEPSVQVFERKAKEPPLTGEAGAAETQKKFTAEEALAPAVSAPLAPAPTPAVAERAIAAPSPTVEVLARRRSR